MKLKMKKIKNPIYPITARNKFAKCIRNGCEVIEFLPDQFFLKATTISKRKYEASAWARSGMRVCIKRK